MALEFNIIKNKYGQAFAYIRNSLRVNGIPTHQTLVKFPKLPEDTLVAMKAAFDRKSVTQSAFELENLEILKSREFGASDALYKLARNCGLVNCLYSNERAEWLKSALAMIIGRILYQGSKLSLSKVGEFSSLWEVCGIDNVVVDRHCYNALDELLKRQELIQGKLAKTCLCDGCVVLYDITSSYFEGEYKDSELVHYGYNRDKKRGKKQIVIALLCAKNGRPFAVEVFPGNTNDGSTVQSKLVEIQQKYGINRCVFVGDRGMLTETNIDAFPESMAYITALKHAAMRDLVKNNGHIQLSLFDEKTYTEVTLPDNPNVRYILKKNPKRQADESGHRLALIEKAERELAKIAMPKRKCSREKLAVRASKILGKFHVQKYFRQDIVENPDNKKLPKLLFSRDYAVIKSAEDFDGLYVLSTDVSTEMMTTVEVVETYRSLINVEQAFRQMKTVELEIRPVYHTRDDRIKAHVFVCMLAYFLLWNFRQRITSLVESDPKTYTLDYILNVLKSRTVNQILYNGIEATKINMPTQIQKKILETLSSLT